jgi:hypothetical protein
VGDQKQKIVISTRRNVRHRCAPVSVLLCLCASGFGLYERIRANPGLRRIHGQMVFRADRRALKYCRAAIWQIAAPFAAASFSSSRSIRRLYAPAACYSTGTAPSATMLWSKLLHSNQIGPRDIFGKGALQLPKEGMPLLIIIASKCLSAHELVLPRR